ncbi:Scramblase [Ancylostoma duodenale]|uniref:Phospholipid scramblase n=1 Tax=Ancylostoma duodenale TaxID=51022 RepID=A0A0C2H019_9BILA|nr:Scramblase [Ancylostoma duodenale]
MSSFEVITILVITQIGETKGPILATDGRERRRRKHASVYAQMCNVAALNVQSNLRLELWLIGTVMQRSEYCSRIYEIKGVDDNFSLRVKRPCACPCLIDIEFPFHTASGENIGSITRKWGGWARAVYNDADVFSVTFPLELDVRAKAVLLGATFLIDFLDFECPEGPPSQLSNLNRTR